MNNFDPQTGLPINQGTPTPAPIGYDPQTGAPIYAENVQPVQQPQAPQFEQAPQTEQVPQYQQAPQTEQAPQFQQAPQYQQAPQFEQAPQYQQTPQFEQAPQFQQAPQYNAYIPPEPPAKKKSHTGLIVGILVVAIVAVLAALFFLLVFPKLSGGSAKEKVMKSFGKTFTSDNMLAEYLGSETLIAKMDEEPYQLSFDVTLDSLNSYDSSLSMIEGIGLSNGLLAFDLENTKLYFESGINYAGVVDFLTLSALLDEDGIALACPDLFDGYLAASFDALAAEFEDTISALDSIDSAQMAAATEELEEIAQKLSDAITVESTDSKTLSLGGKDTKCSGYTVTISADGITEFISDITDSAVRASDIPLTDDISFEVYLDKQGRLVMLSMEDIDLDGITLDGEISFLGGEFPLDEVDGEFSIGISGMMSFSVSVESETDRTATSTETTTNLGTMGQSIVTLYSSVDTATGDFEANVSLADLAEMSMSGTYSNVVTGTSYDMTIDQLSYSYQGTTVSVSGAIGVAPYEGTFDVPAGTRYDINSDSDMEALGEDIISHVEDNSNLLDILSDFSFGSQAESVSDYDYDYDDSYSYDDSEDDYTSDNLPNFAENIANDYYYYQDLFNDKYYEYYDYLTDYDTFIYMYQLYDDTYRDLCQITFSYFLFEYYYYLEYDYDDYNNFHEYMASWYNLAQ